MARTTSAKSSTTDRQRRTQTTKRETPPAAEAGEGRDDGVGDVTLTLDELAPTEAMKTSRTRWSLPPGPLT